MSDTHPLDELGDQEQEAAQAPSGEQATPIDEGVVSPATHSADELREANERVLRGQAELENYRKRARRELEEQRRYAALPVVADLLAVVDNLDRAIEASDQTHDEDGLREGVKMVASLLHGVLEKHGCRPIAAIGQPFDPHVHEALAQEASSEHAAGTVSRVTRVGYSLHDRVVRPSQVFVSTGPGPSETAPSPPETDAHDLA